MTGNDVYLEVTTKKNIRPLVITNKVEYVSDIQNIEFSLTARVDVLFANRFILEACQLLYNSIQQFELGYFDSAYYSIRQAIEISTTMVYLSDIDDELKARKLSAWTSSSWFPMQKKMLEYLKENGCVMSDMKVHMKQFFDFVDCTSKRINKYVHKQGFEHLYVYRNGPMNYEKDCTNFTRTFLENLENCISIVAIMRLAIDPFPLLLTDEEIYHRTEDTLTQGYSDEFIKKYIVEENLQSYKKTEIFTQHYEVLNQKEKMNEFTTFLVKNNFINTEHIEEILSQKHLLKQIEVIMIYICKHIPNISKIYLYGGMDWYFTDLESDRKKTQWSSSDFKEFSCSTKKFNISYDEAFISVFKVGDSDIYIETNGIISESQIKNIKKCIYKGENEKG